MKVDEWPNVISKHEKPFYLVSYQVKLGEGGLYTFVFGRVVGQNPHIYLARRPYHVERVKERLVLSPQDPLNEG